MLPFATYLHQHTDWDITFVCDQNEDFASRLPSYIHYQPIAMKRGISLAGIKAAWQMFCFFKARHFDLIQYSTPNASLYSALAGKLAGIPIRLYAQWGFIYESFDGVKRLIFKQIEKLTCALSTHIETVSLSSLHFAHQERLYPPSKGTIIWHGSACGINLAKFDVAQKQKYRQEIRQCYQIPADAFVFGFVGRITRDKGINELFQAAQRLLSQYKHIYFLLIGPEEIDKTIQNELYSWSKQTARFIYTGYTRQVEKYLSAMDCLVLPSYREGFGLCLIEAESMAVPVIVTDIPGPIDAMQPGLTGELIQKKNAASLLNAMEKMLTADLSTYGQNGVKFVREHFEQTTLLGYLLSERARLLHV